jgi:DNA-binding NarL/FixJ family response regulator
LKVLIADDHPLILAGIRRALERGEGVEVVGEAHTRAELMGLAERRAPEIVLLDLRMPDVAGTEHIEELLVRWPHMKIVVLSASEDQAAVDSAMRAGASAFLVKSVSPADIPALLRQVAGGAVVRPLSVEPNDESHTGDAAGLTDRERTILEAATRGLMTSEIAGELFISEHTVKFHLTNLYRKLGVANRAAAVRWALEHGLGVG